MKLIKNLTLGSCLLLAVGCFNNNSIGSDTNTLDSSSIEESSDIFTSFSSEQSSQNQTSSPTESSSNNDDTPPQKQSSGDNESSAPNTDTSSSSAQQESNSPLQTESSDTSSPESSSSSTISSSSAISSSSIQNFAEKYNAPEGSPVATYGLLKTQGNRIVGENGEEVQLIGMSLFWSQWEGDFYNDQLMDWLVGDWKVDIVRAALGIDHEKGGNATGYTVNPEIELAKIETVITRAIHHGIYVLIDWHDHFANWPEQRQMSKDFFDKMSKKYKDTPNVIYEIFNEPTQNGEVSWNMDPNFNWGDIETYMDEVISVIRTNDTKNHIVIGSPKWSKQPGTALTSVLEGKINDPHNNFSFTIHFYAGGDKEDLRNSMNETLENGYPLFATEWGSGRPVKPYIGVDYESSDEWLQWMKDNKISWCNWSIADKDEDNAALRTGASTTGNWGPDNLTESGKYLRKYIREAHGENGDAF